MALSRTVIVSLLLLFIAGIARAQEEETLLGGGFESGGYGGPVVKFTNVKGEFAVMAGGYGGWLINHSLMLGGGGYGLVTHHYLDVPAGSFKLYVVEHHGNGNITVRPEAVFGT